MSAHLWEVDRSRILNIPIGVATSRDRMVWHYSKTGAFTVASCYHMIFAHRMTQILPTTRESGQGSGSNTINLSLIWKLNVPPKLRMFLWRASLETLPHKAEHRCIFLPVVEECKRFGNPASSRCRKWIWGVSFWAWLISIKKQCTESIFLLAVTVMWKVWETRNSETHRAGFDPPSDVVEWCRLHLQVFWNSRSHIYVQQARTRMCPRVLLQRDS